MVNVGGAKGAKLTVIPEYENEPAKEPKEEKRPEPVAPPPKAKPFTVQVNVESGWFSFLADDEAAAKEMAKGFIRNGAWQIVGNRQILHGPASIHRVVVMQ